VVRRLKLEMKKIFFIAAHRLNRSPSQRFRFEQYLLYLSQNGYQCDFSYLISAKDEKVFYKSGNYVLKLIIFIKCFVRRIIDVLKANQYDCIFIQREAFMTGSIFFEKWFKNQTNSKVIFDFDDSIWLHNVSDLNKKFAWLKRPEKTSKIIGLAGIVFAGNKYLADYAMQFNQNVKIVPTTIDTNEYIRVENEKNQNDDRVCIGWSGSFTTIQHFDYATPILIKIKEKYGESVYFKVIGDSSYFNRELDVYGIDWNKDNEINELSQFDIGIMPLPDNDWSRGKCGLKGLQYMALEIPTVMSPVGVNVDIIEDSVNGFLAEDSEGWIAKLSLLIESASLRSSIGIAGRKTVLNKYSVNSQKEYYLNLFNEFLVVNKRGNQKV